MQYIKDGHSSMSRYSTGHGSWGSSVIRHDSISGNEGREAAKSRFRHEPQEEEDAYSGYKRKKYRDADDSDEDDVYGYKSRRRRDEDDPDEADVYAGYKSRRYRDADDPDEANDYRRKESYRKRSSHYGEESEYEDIDGMPETEDNRKLSEIIAEEEESRPKGILSRLGFNRIKTEAQKKRTKIINIIFVSIILLMYLFIYIRSKLP